MGMCICYSVLPGIVRLALFLILCCFLQTDKTMAELEIDINMKIREWDVIQVHTVGTSCAVFSMLQCEIEKALDAC